MSLAAPGWASCPCSCWPPSQRKTSGVHPLPVVIPLLWESRPGGGELPNTAALYSIGCLEKPRLGSAQGSVWHFRVNFNWCHSGGVIFIYTGKFTAALTSSTVLLSLSLLVTVSQLWIAWARKSKVIHNLGWIEIKKGTTGNDGVNPTLEQLQLGVVSVEKNTERKAGFSRDYTWTKGSSDQLDLYYSGWVLQWWLLSCWKALGTTCPL